jgi:outer membrane immunogenic protein
MTRLAASKNSEAIYASGSDAVPRDNWSGLYLGASFGVGTARSAVASHETYTSTSFQQLIDSTGVASSQTGAVVDLFIGTNVKLSERVVVGAQVEGTLSEMNFGSSGFRNYANTNVFGPPPTTTTSTSTNGFNPHIHSRWMATALARGGWLVDQTMLLYGLAGWTVAQFDVQGITNNGFFEPGELFFANGPTVGGGIEKKLSANWSLRAEYRYTRFGTKVVNDPYFSFTSVSGADTFTQTHAQQTSYKSDMQVGRLGIAYSMPVGR